MTPLLLVYSPFVKEYDILESSVEEVANSLQGAIEVGSINCQNEQTFFKDLGITPSRIPGLFIYSYKTTERGSLVEYNGEWDSKSLKNFCQDQLPRVSRRIDLVEFVCSSSTEGNLPQLLLLSAEKDTPVLWRALSGLYRNRFHFFDAEAHDISDHLLRKLGVNTLLAVIGWLSIGNMRVLSAGTLKELKTGISELNAFLDLEGSFSSSKLARITT